MHTAHLVYQTKGLRCQMIMGLRKLFDKFLRTSLYLVLLTHHFPDFRIPEYQQAWFQ